MEAAAEQVESALGPISVLVNNAAATQRKRFLDTTADDWQAQVDVTVTGMLRITHAVARRMAERDRGSIVSLLGDSGRVGESGILVTATTRSSTVGLTKSLAKELARHQIRANAVSIALVQTDSLDAHTGEHRRRTDAEDPGPVPAAQARAARGRGAHGAAARLALVFVDHRSDHFRQRRVRDAVRETR